jgi:hypothetical protein
LTAKLLIIRLDPFLGLEQVVCKGNPVTVSSGLNSAIFFFKDTTAEGSYWGWTDGIQQQTVLSLR